MERKPTGLFIPQLVKMGKYVFGRSFTEYSDLYYERFIGLTGFTLYYSPVEIFYCYNMVPSIVSNPLYCRTINGFPVFH